MRLARVLLPISLACALLCLGVAPGAFAGNATAANGSLPADATASLSWRLVGPFRGGWGSAVAGIPDQPDTYYFGAAGGGVWKTVDSGRTWHSIFDQGPASIGAIAIAPSDPRVIYVGTGQITTRYDMAAGAGMFKSSDGGATWHPIGLQATRHIGSIWVDPGNPDVVLVAAFGHMFGPNPERGVFRSEDGGKTWTQTLFVSDRAGAVDIVADPRDAQVMFASVWETQFLPWQSYFTPTTGSQSGIYKSTDGGRTWSRLDGKGWPQGKLSRIGLAATHTAQGTRVYADIDAPVGGGLYRSDDAGANWQLVNADGELIDSYFARIVVAPDDPDTLWTAGRSIHRCTQAGTHCEIVKGAPGGDDYHELWINPKHPERMITGSDQGTVVSVDGGATWSSWYNQPTAQLYHLATDNRFPYWIYAGQQDSGTVAIASRSDYGSISYRDWHSVGADERDDEVPDPRDPDIVYGSGLGGKLTRWDARNGEVQDISPWPVSSYGARPTSVKYHYTWITPIAVSPIAPYPLYLGAQVLFRSTDQGAHWETISPDLSGKNPNQKDCEGDLQPAAAKACGYGVIFSFGLSPRDNDEIWLGMDDGGVQLTRDGGKSWKNVAPAALPMWAKVSTVDVSALDPGTAYIAVDNHRQDDFAPHAWRTRDYGKTWTDISAGLPAGHFVATLRADPVQRGLLYAGTDEGVSVSFDDGAHWQSLQRNLPNAIVNDLAVHGDDLVAATQGRSIWVLDDLSPLRQMDAAIFRQDAHLFTPATVIRVRGNQNKDTPLPREEPVGTNPPHGAIFDYWLARDAKGPVTLSVYDAAGHRLRRFASDAAEEKLPAHAYFESRWLRPEEHPSARAGMHRFVWNLRLQRPLATGYDYAIEAIDGQDTPLLPRGMLAAPGRYRVVLDADGHESAAEFEVKTDPRVAVDAAALQSAMDLSTQVVAAMERHYVANGEVRGVQAQVEALQKRIGEDAKRADARKALDAYAARLAPLTSGEGEDALNLEAIGGALASVQIGLEGSDRAPTQPQREVVADYGARLGRAIATWTAIRNDLPTLNSTLKSAGLGPISVPARAQFSTGDPGASREMP